MPPRPARPTPQRPRSLSLRPPNPRPPRRVRPTPEQAAIAGDPSGPVRTCVGCRARRTQAELIRFVRRPDGTVVGDRHAVGRGAWLCPSGQCWLQATKRNAWTRAFRRPSTASAPPALALPEDGFRHGCSRD
ncbi:MAG: YlxR family protein [Acidimicrobiia bacterium]